MKLSVIIPAYNEGKSIYLTLDRLVRSLSQRRSFEWEVIVVSDGSTDSTVLEARRLKDSRVRVFHYRQNQGKGQALRFGVSKSSGDVVTFMDAGGDFDSDLVDKFLKVLEAFEVDIVIGSKRHSFSQVKNYPSIRRLYSFAYSMLLRLLFRLNIRDTQVGFKVFKRAVLLELLKRAVVKKYAFDVELLVIARHLNYKIFEAPVKMNFNPASSGINFEAIRNILWDTAAISYRKYILRYYDQPKPSKTLKKKVLEQIGIKKINLKKPSKLFETQPKVRW